jgi:predicted nucleotidyltransferase
MNTPGGLAEHVARRHALLERGVQRLIAISRELSDVRALYVFGSFARGDIRRRSDLDVLVVRDTTVRRADRDLDLRRAFDVPIGIDLVVVTPEELRERLPRTGMGRTILAEMRCVYAA